MPPTAPVAPTAPSIPKAPPSEVDLLRAQVLELSERLNAVLGTSQGRTKKPAPVYAHPAWEEEVYVEALQRGYYPQPHDTYAICRLGPQDGEDARGNPVKTRGSVFKLMHREHFSTSWMREVQANDPAIVDVPAPRIPQTTARSQNRQSPFPPL